MYGFRYMGYILNLILTFQPAVKQTDPGTKYPVLHKFAIRKLSQQYTLYGLRS